MTMKPRSSLRHFNVTFRPAAVSGEADDETLAVLDQLACAGQARAVTTLGAGKMKGSKPMTHKAFGGLSSRP